MTTARLRPMASSAQVRTAILAIVGCGMALTLLQRGLLVTMSGEWSKLWMFLVFDASMWVLWLFLSPAVVIAARQWPFHDASATNLIAHLVVAAALSAVHTALFIAVDAPFGGASFDRSLVYVSASMLTWRLAIDSLVYGTIVAGTLALDAAARARADEVAALQAAAESSRARLHALQMQIQPHFLFNALNTAAMMAHTGDAAAAADVITRLSELLRELVAEDAQSRVSVRDELGFVERYLAIERARFGERLRVSVVAAPETLDVPIPRLLLQPVVENAVRHGLSRSPSSGAVGISATSDDGWLLLRVTDDGPGPSSDPDPVEGLGLGNTRSRLAALYGDDFELTLSGSATGAVVTMRLPIAAALA